MIKNPMRLEAAHLQLRGLGLDVQALIDDGTLATTDLPDQPYLYVDRDEVRAIAERQRALRRMGAFSSPAGATVAAPGTDETAAEISRILSYCGLAPDKKKTPANSTLVPDAGRGVSVQTAAAPTRRPAGPQAEQQAEIDRLVNLSTLRPASALTPAVQAEVDRILVLSSRPAAAAVAAGRAADAGERSPRSRDTIEAEIERLLGYSSLGPDRKKAPEDLARAIERALAAAGGSVQPSAIDPAAAALVEQLVGLSPLRPAARG